MFFGRMYMTYTYLLSSDIHISEYIFKNCQHSDWKKIQFNIGKIRIILF